MFMPKTDEFTAAERIWIEDQIRPQTDMTPKHGVLAGGLLETEAGWRPVETLRPGDRLHTFDGGLRPLRLVTELEVPAFMGEVIRVAGGAFNACSDILLLPGQPIFTDHRAVQDVLDLPGALISASDLDGYDGCHRMRLPKPVSAYALTFDEDEVIYANSGLRLHCPGSDASPRESFDRLTRTQTKALLDLMATGAIWSDGAALAA